MVKKRRRHAAAYKFQIALEGNKTISQLSSCPVNTRFIPA